ncbi:MAG TPA: hypothetical protein VFG88_13480 [Nocardioidaceae bacterium]|jgi:2'-5' RNA ligase|nr:hypothetical protein [Nocardioidaceae bacterium]
MRLYAALLPPASLCEEASRVVHAALDRPETLAVRPPAAMRLHLTNFGNVAHADALALRRALAREAVSWPRPKLQLAGAAALESPGDVSVWSRVEGDVDELYTLARGIPSVVQRLGFLVDRRAFRPWVALGDITASTTGPALERVYAAVDAHRSEPWVVDELSVIRPRRMEDGEVEQWLDVIDRIPLGG